jgi:tetratricopeptide (TPR) repeat protein
MAKRSKKIADVREAPWLRSDWLWSLILLVVVVVTYSPVWWAGFIWDDDDVVTANPVIVGPLGLKEIWTTSAADICPLTLTTFWFEHALWGGSSLPYHLVNVLLHGICGVALWRVLRCLEVPGAWLGAALWALNPVMVESVAWITEMKNTESGLFYLLAILFFVKDLRMASVDQRSGWNWNHALTLLFAALAMASKSSTVILPVVLCLCAWWVEGRWQWRNLTKVVPIFLLSVIVSLVSIWTQKVRGADDSSWMQTWPERIVTAGHAVWFYLGKLMWPYPLMIVYPRWEAEAGSALSYLPPLAVIVVWLFLWRRRESWLRPFFFAYSYFLVALVPVLGLVNNTFLRYSFVADHFQYLAAMGPLALAGAGVIRLADFFIPGRGWLPSILEGGVLLVLGIATWQRVWVYESEETLWTDELSKNPDCWVGYYDLGHALFQKGQVEEAMALYEKAVEINPRFAKAHNNLGLALFQQGEIDEAMVHYRKALEINPDFAEARNNFGLALLQEKQPDEAMTQFQQSLEINPGNAEAHINLGIALAQEGRSDEAILHFQKAVEISPKNARAYNNLGIALFQKGQVDEAILNYEKALKINPDDIAAHTNFGRALLQKGEADAAVIQFQEVLRLNPADDEAQNNLAQAQAMAQQKAGSNKF